MALCAIGGGFETAVRHVISTIRRTASSSVGLTCFEKCFSHYKGSLLFINSPPDIMVTVPSGASLKSSDFVLFLGKFKAGGIKKPRGFMQQTAVTVRSHVIQRNENKELVRIHISQSKSIHFQKGAQIGQKDVRSLLRALSVRKFWC